MSRETLRSDEVGFCLPGRQRRWLFRDLSLSVHRGEIVVVVGPNGAGKTTLLRTLLGLVATTSGYVSLFGRPLATFPRRELSRTIAYLSQRPDFPHDMSVERVVGLGRVPHLAWHGSFTPADRRAVDAALEATQTADLRIRGMLSLSGGEAQRVMLARMLCTEAPVLVLDEPTTALDIGHTFALLKQCRSLADEGKAIVLSMHEIDLARRVSDRVLCLYGDDTGQYGLGSPSDVLAPDLVRAVFGVDVAVENGVLVFEPERLRG